MSEHFANINFEKGETIKATAENVRLYTHIGALAVYDHLWVTTSEDGAKGAYIFAQIPPDNPSYTELAPVAVQYGIELHINQRRVADADKEAFERHASNDLDGFDVIPSDWV
jgi:hypothetical protein